MSIGAVWRFLKHSTRQYGRDNCPQLAAAISYYVLFSIVPLTFVLVSIFGLVIRSESLRADVVREVVDSLGLEKGDAQLILDEGELGGRLSQSEIDGIKAAIANLTEDDRARVVEELDQEGRAEIGGEALNASEVEVRYQNSVSDTLNGVAGASAPLTVFGLLASVWSASAMFAAVRRALNIVWNVDYQRPFAQQKLLDLVMVATFGLLLLASVVGTGVLRALRTLSDDAMGPLSSGTGPFWEVLPYVLPGLVSFVVFCLLYRFVPAVSIRFRDVWVGALAASLLFEILKNGLALYVANFNAYDLLYGSLGGILLFLTGVYFASAILLLGGEMAAATPALKAGAFASTPDPNKPKAGLPGEIRREVLKFLRGLVLAPRRGDGDRKDPDQTPRGVRR